MDVMEGVGAFGGASAAAIAGRIEATVGGLAVGSFGNSGRMDAAIVGGTVPSVSSLQAI